MRTAMITGMIAVFGYAASAQFSLLPQVGFENSRTNISYNNLRDFSPLGVKFSPQASLRMDYKFKKGHGPFLGLSSSRSLVSFSFSDPENGRNVFNATTGDIAANRFILIKIPHNDLLHLPNLLIIKLQVRKKVTVVSTPQDHPVEKQNQNLIPELNLIPAVAAVQKK